MNKILLFFMIFMLVGCSTKVQINEKVTDTPVINTEIRPDDTFQTSISLVQDLVIVDSEISFSLIINTNGKGLDAKLFLLLNDTPIEYSINEGETKSNYTFPSNGEDLIINVSALIGNKEIYSYNSIRLFNISVPSDPNTTLGGLEYHTYDIVSFTFSDSVSPQKQVLYSNHTNTHFDDFTDTIRSKYLTKEILDQTIDPMLLLVNQDETSYPTLNSGPTDLIYINNSDNEIDLLVSLMKNGLYDASYSLPITMKVPPRSMAKVEDVLEVDPSDVVSFLVIRDGVIQNSQVPVFVSSN